MDIDSDQNPLYKGSFNGDIGPHKGHIVGYLGEGAGGFATTYSCAYNPTIVYLIGLMYVGCPSGT